jgi:hypothetical protein
MADEIIWHRRFADVLSRRPNGQRVVDYSRFHQVQDNHQRHIPSK